MLLIADCGGTKTDWCLISDKNAVKHFSTPGMNAALTPAEVMQQRIHDDLSSTPGCDPARVDRVVFYGAGCASDSICGDVRQALSLTLPGASIEVYSDLLGTARALCQHHAGIACILGTGSNSCLYNGEVIADNIPSLGFILGDEGSGANLGRRLLTAALKRQLPPDLAAEFLSQYGLDVASAIDHVYRQPRPNSFLASLSPFVHSHLSHPAIRKIAYDSFTSFFANCVLPYRRNHPDVDTTINFCGSVAFHYSALLAEIAGNFGYSIGRILASPISGLVEYHTT